ncbi:piggyBac transposable element-derived protein 4-like [Helicoverpa zea]|uniref:piggyBac transposable element-derived protein 4-like n=1 Tax=Helicoverpa zea TaxID=7113 RepID=UPI001F58B7E6|nr:piggyBac transposable element-derived protein 4-like [Helicoverpa zea]XP_047036367.1 piggyBac transposable element-derived protein 4-like [Helicoverpa zea]XP_047036368.1 piggyBac transposable element-derived protein 4-like [Helicoverpa zea]
MIRNIEELPEGRGLETALHPKRMRRWQPSNVPPPSSASPSSPSRSARAAPSPHLSPASPRRRRRLLDKCTSDLINYGSDDDSDNSDEEGDIVAPVVPRVCRTLMETPLDHDYDVNTAGDPAPATHSTLAGGLEPADVPLRATEQPWRLYDFNWREFPNPPPSPESRREFFSNINVGPTTPHADPYDIFIEIWDRQIMEHIASETNRYARQVVSQMCNSNQLFPRSRIIRWYDTTADELYVYFGLNLAMGIVSKSRLEEYWGSTPDVFHTPGFSAHMSIDRFLLINKCLHFNNNDDMRALDLDYSEARLFKIKPILVHLNQKFQSMYTPAQNLALDESLLMWKGWLEICQLIPNKAANRGIKTYEICESRTGYLWRFEIHAHKRSQPQHYESPLDASTPAIVLKLVQGLEHKGYTLWMDNFYNSPCLARRLKCLGFDCVGTLRTDRKFVPQVLNSLTKTNMRRGQIAGLSSGDVDIMVWRDNSRVAMISTYHGNGQQTVGESTKPILILDYNIMMGGVDKKDQLLAMYPVERKRSKVWYKKLFRRLLNVSVLNSYIIHQHTSSVTHRNFRMRLVKSILSKHSTTPRIPPALTQHKADVSHRLSMYPKGKHQRLRRACAACNKRVLTFCVGCLKTVCMEPCFLKIHS